MPPGFSETIDAAAKQSPLIATLVFILYGGYKRWWVWGYQLKDMTLDRDEWKQLALRARFVTERAVETTSKAVDVLKGAS